MDEYRQKMQEKFQQDQVIKQQNQLFGSKLFSSQSSNQIQYNQQKSFEMQSINMTSNNQQINELSEQTQPIPTYGSNEYQQNQEGQYVNLEAVEQPQLNEQKFSFFHKMNPNAKILFIANLIIIGLILIIFLASY